MIKVTNKESIDCFLNIMQKATLDYYCAGDDEKKINLLSMVSQSMQSFLLEAENTRINVSALTTAVVYYYSKNKSDCSAEANYSLSRFIDLYNTLQDCLPMLSVLGQSLREWEELLEKEDEQKKREKEKEEQFK